MPVSTAAAESPEQRLITIRDLDRLSRRCRTIGVEILSEGQVVRAKTMPPPPVKMTPAPGSVKVTNKPEK